MAASASDEILAEITRLRNLGKSWDLSNDQINECIKNSFDEPQKLQNILDKFRFYCKQCFKICLFTITFCISLYFLISCHNPTKRFFSRHIQGLIYPFMRLLRLTALPIHQFYDATHLYQESCLINNPFYVEPMIDCSPCQGVRFVMDLSGLTNFTQYYNYGIPFVIKDSRETLISTEKLTEFYLNNKHHLDQGTFKFSSNQPEISSPEDLFTLNPSTNPSFHCSWSFNKVQSTRSLRKIFKRPNFIPKDTEVSLQKFLFFDGHQSKPFSPPITDFTNIWLEQTQGTRLLVLEPSDQCQYFCSPVSTVLQPNQILYYNWQYWRPVSFSVNASRDLSITFMGSFY